MKFSNVTLISNEDENKALKTQEFWNLLFESENGAEDYVVNRLNTQIYFIKKIYGVWKIWDNYNPNAGEMSYEVKN